MAATQKVMEQLLDGNGEALHLSGELVIAKNKGETFAQHAADTTRHLTSAQVDTAIETALAPIQEELDQIAGGGTGGGGDSLKVGDILLTANSKRDVSSFLFADGSRIRAEPYPDLGQVLGTEFVAADAPTTLSFTYRYSDNSGLGRNYHKLSCSPPYIVASLRSYNYSLDVTTYAVSIGGTAWSKKTAPEAYTDICYLNNEWICACKSKLYTNPSITTSTWAKRCDFPWPISTVAGFLYNLGYGDGIYFCAPTTNSNKVYISTDKMKTWAPKSAEGIGDPEYSAYHDGYYMFFGGDSKTGKMYYSTDKGETWTVAEVPFLVDTSYKSTTTFTLDGKLYLLSPGMVAISTKLPEWEAHPVEVTVDSTTTQYTGPVFYAEGFFIAASSIYNNASYAVSADGLHWTPASVTRPFPPSSGTSSHSLSVISSAIGNGDGTLVTSSTHTVTQYSNSVRNAILHVAQPTIEKKYYLTLPNVTCPGAKAYVKAL